MQGTEDASPRSGMKLGQATRVTFCADPLGPTQIIKRSGSDLDSALTALLECSDRALKVQSCY